MTWLQIVLEMEVSTVQALDLESVCVKISYFKYVYLTQQMDQI